MSIFLKHFFYGKVLKIRRPPSSAVAHLVYRTLIAIFDTLDDLLRWAWPVDKRPEDSVRNINSLGFDLNPCFYAVRRI